ncbi:hypothetical protein NDU88_002197 [Pleurodeles waltl]|uniref:L1 transposable element RRM domain-containing protein n=1 Tax=Pleurodeles waltl TaxID=8319 RepID=A0AAV7T2I5_PLEWA|nr:hypothetical protein NDU88_002197 [Pleurodeles waltl]
MISDGRLGDELRKAEGLRGGDGGARGAPRASQPLLDRARRIGSTGEPQAPEGDARSPLRNRGERRTKSRHAARRDKIYRRVEIAPFQWQISGLDQRVTTVETQVASWTDRDQELMHLRSKLTDLEDRSRRNNIRLLGFPEGIEGTDILSYLRDILPKLTDITFDPLLEFERVHRLGPKRQDGKGRPRSIIACLLRHGQARQLLQAARAQGLLRLGTLEIRLSADFSKETADRRRAFLSLRHLDVKFGLFEPARM